MEMTKTSDVTLAQIQAMPKDIHRRTAFSRYILSQLVYPGKSFLVQYGDGDVIKIISDEGPRLWLNFNSRKTDDYFDYITFELIRLEVVISDLSEQDVTNIVELLNQEIARRVKASKGMCTVQ